MTERIAAIVLAGGRSTRFGRDKLAEPINGQRMLDRAIAAVAQVADVVMVIAPPDSVPAITSQVQMLHDARAFEGPLAGLATGLDAMDPTIERVIVVGGDMPTLVPAVLRRLIDALETHEAAALADAAGPRPLPIALRRSVAGPVVGRLLAGGERRLRALVDELQTFFIPAADWLRDDPTGATLADVDTPADLPDRS